MCAVDKHLFITEVNAVVILHKQFSLNNSTKNQRMNVVIPMTQIVCMAKRKQKHSNNLALFTRSLAQLAFATNELVPGCFS